MGRLVKLKNNVPESIESKNFEREEELQEIVKQFPEIIPLDELDEGAYPILVIGREFTTREAGSIDLLGIDAQGLITLIEFKLEKNSDIRKVVAQTIEYAANLWELPYNILDKSAQNYFNSNRCSIPELKNRACSKVT